MPEIKIKVAIIVIMLMMSSIGNAENYKFVDAEDDTGYYVDMDAVKIENGAEISAKIGVVKANLNKMYVYEVRINHERLEYQIKSSEIIEYDTREILETNKKERGYRPYSEHSQMSELVKYILGVSE